MPRPTEVLGMQEMAQHWRTPGPAEPKDLDPVRWFEETLNAWVAAGEGIADPWRLQELVAAAQARRLDPAALNDLLVSALAREAMPHLSTPLRHRLPDALRAFAGVMQGVGESEARPTTVPTVEAIRTHAGHSETTACEGADFETRIEQEVTQRLREHEASLAEATKRSDQGTVQVREAIARSRRRLRLLAEAVASHRGVAEGVADECATQQATLTRVLDALATRDALIAGGSETLDAVRRRLEQVSPTDPTSTPSLLDELACEIHLARVTTSAEVARQGESSAIASVAALMRRLDDRVRHLCAEHAELRHDETLQAHTDALDLLTTLAEQFDAHPTLSAEQAAAGQLDDLAVPHEVASCRSDDSANGAERVARSFERIAALVDECIRCCDATEARAKKIPSETKSQQTAPTAGAAV